MAIIPNDFLYPYQWDRKIIKDSEAWQLLNDAPSVGSNKKFGSPDLIIAIVDDGIDTTHPDLSGALSDGSQKLHKAFNFRVIPSAYVPANFPVVENLTPNNDATVLTNEGHGVLCAGVATAITGNGQGISGVAGNCKLIGVRLPLEYQGQEIHAELYKWIAGSKTKNSISGFPSQLLSGADIMSTSYGPFQNLPISTLMSEAFNLITSIGRGGRGTLMFFSSGNANANLNTNIRPWGIYEKCFSIGASTLNANGFQEIKAPYSSYGTELEFVTPSSSAGSFHNPPASYKIVTTSIQDNHPLTPPTNKYSEHGGDIPGTAIKTTSLQNPVSIGDFTIDVVDVTGIQVGMSVLVGDPNSLSSEAANKIFSITGNTLSLKDSYAECLQFPANHTNATFKKAHGAGTNVYIGKRDYYTRHGQTSSSTPVAAGIAALVLTANPNLSWVEVRHILRTTAQKIDIGFNGISASNVGKWKDSSNNIITSSSLTNLANLTQAINSSASFRLTDTLHVSSVSGYSKGDSVFISEGSTNEWKFILDIAGSTIIIDPIINNYTTAATIKKGAKPNFSEVYGYGRLNSAIAVQAALDYDLNSRDLKLRDSLIDDGTLPNSYVAVNSPDIWNRNSDPATDGNNAYPGNSNNFGANFNTSGSSEIIKLDSDSYLYARIHNAGVTANPTTASNLDAWVRFYVAITDQAPSQDLFSFPDNWYGTDDITQLYTSGTKIKLLGEVKVNEGDLAPGTISGITTSNIGVLNLKWKKELKPHKDNALKTYILALITPFDGGRAETKVYQNNNLSYREITFANVIYKSGAGTGSLQKTIPVDSQGATEILPFKIELQNTEIAFANNIQVKATLTYRNGTAPETVTFKYNGSTWSFITPPSSGWIALSAPILTGTTANGIQEFTTFNGSLTIDNTASKVTLESEQFDGSSISILKQVYDLNVTFNYPPADGGVAAEKKTAIYTFADFDLLPIQSGTNNFGSVASVLTTEYRTWGSFTGIQSGTALKAYAATNGEFFIQEVTGNPNVVNLVIKPDNQPDNKIGMVKYFVYRGLKKGSFLDGSGQVLPSSTTGLSALLTRMWVVRGKLNTEAGITEIITRNDLGLDSTTNTIPSTMLFEDVFDTFVFQKLAPGMHIGEFETSGDYGFQIIVEGPNYKPTLADLRVLDHKVIITYLSGQPQFDNGDEEDIKTKLDREQILSFVDPAAYFGLMAFDKILVNKSTGITTISNDAALVKTEVLDKFATANQIYVDIRNDLNNSLNFYGSYSDSALATKVAKIKFKDSTATFIDKEYHTNGWPILTIPTTDIVSGTTDVVKASFQLPEGDNNLPGLFLSGSSFFADGLKYKDKFKVLNTSSSLTDDFELSLANVGSTSTVLPFIVKLSYTRRYDIDNLQHPVPANLTRPWKDDYIDNLLTLNEVNITPPVNDSTFSNTVKWNTHSELKYIGWTSLKGFDFVVRTGISNDKFGHVFYSIIEGSSEGNSITKTTVTNSNLDINKGQKNLNSFYLSLQDNLKLVVARYREIGSSTPIKCIQIDSVYNNLTVDILTKSANNLFSVAITKSERTAINGHLINMLTNSACYVLLMNHQLLSDNNNLVYYQADFAVQFIAYDNLTFSHSIQQTNTNLKVFSFDGRNYFSENYSTLLSNIIPQIIV